jgi:hypothetical protein
MNAIPIEIVNSSHLSTIKDAVELLSAAIVGVVALLGYIVASRRYLTKRIVGWQAIFLSNGQTYFGKITDETSEYIVISDIYYLQNEVEDGSDIGAFKNLINDPKLQLVKLGNELHGPADTMFVNKSHVMFWENIQDNGRVMQAIKEYHQESK